MLDFSSLPAVITLLIALSVATERFVEIIKGVVVRLNQRSDNPRTEAWRKAALQLLAVLGAIGISALAWPIIAQVLPGQTQSKLVSVIALGLLASGGSGFWNSMLTYVTKLKDLKRVELEHIEKEGAGARPLPQPLEGPLRP